MGSDDSKDDRFSFGNNDQDNSVISVQDRTATTSEYLQVYHDLGFLLNGLSREFSERLRNSFKEQEIEAYLSPHFSREFDINKQKPRYAGKKYSQTAVGFERSRALFDVVVKYDRESPPLVFFPISDRSLWSYELSGQLFTGVQNHLNRRAPELIPLPNIGKAIIYSNFEVLTYNLAHPKMLSLLTSWAEEGYRTVFITNESKLEVINEVHLTKLSYITLTGTTTDEVLKEIDESLG